MRKFLSNQSGMSIIEVLISIGISVVVASLTAQMLIGQQKSLRLLSNKAGIIDVTHQLQNFTMKADICSCMLNGTTVPKVGEKTNLKKLTQGCAASSVLFEENSPVSQNASLKVKEINLENPLLIGTGKYSADLTVTYTQPQDEMALKPSTVKILIDVDSSNKITSCKSQSVDLAPVCASFGGEWDDTTLSCKMPEATATTPPPTIDTDMCTSLGGIYNNYFKMCEFEAPPMTQSIVGTKSSGWSSCGSSGYPYVLGGAVKCTSSGTGRGVGSTCTGGCLAVPRGSLQGDVFSGNDKMPLCPNGMALLSVNCSDSTCSHKKFHQYKCQKLEGLDTSKRVGIIGDPYDEGGCDPGFARCGLFSCCPIFVK